MNARRIIATQRGGRSVVVQNTLVPHNAFRSVPGFDPAVLWGTPAEPSVPWDGKDMIAAASTVLPDVGGTTLFMVSFPPDSIMAEPSFDPMAAGAEYAQRLPGLAELFERDNPGMHRTDTIDYDIVLDGEITVEFDDGVTLDLNRGDVLVGYGMRHAWRNKSERTATMIFVLIGAARRA